MTHLEKSFIFKANQWQDMLGGGSPVIPNPGSQQVIWGHNVNNSNAQLKYAAVSTELGVSPPISRYLYSNDVPSSIAQYMPTGGNRTVSAKKRSVVSFGGTNATPAQIISGAKDAAITAFAATCPSDGMTYLAYFSEANNHTGEAGLTGANWQTAIQHISALLAGLPSAAYVVPGNILVAPQGGGKDAAGNRWEAAGISIDAWLPTFASMNNPHARMIMDNYLNPRGYYRASAPTVKITGLDGAYPPPALVVDQLYGKLQSNGWLQYGFGEYSTPVRNFDTDGSGQAAALTAYMDYLQALPVPPEFACAWETGTLNPNSPGNWDQNWSDATIAAVQPYMALAAAV